MDENLINELIKTNKKQLFWQRISAIGLAGLLATVIVVACILVPEATKTLNYIDEVAIKEQETLEEINKVAASVVESSTNLNQLVENNAQELTDAVKSISEIDFEGLNQTITDFQTAVGPLASFMSRFR